MIAVDTNVLLRYLIHPLDNRNPNWQHKAAVVLIDSAEHVYVTDIVLAEMEWVLESYFGFNRNEILRVLTELSQNPRFIFESWSALQCALMDYREISKADFSDCLIARRAQEKQARLFTFEGVAKLGAHPNAQTITHPSP